MNEMMKNNIDLFNYTGKKYLLTLQRLTNIQRIAGISCNIEHTNQTYLQFSE